MDGGEADGGASKVVDETVRQKQSVAVALRGAGGGDLEFSQRSPPLEPVQSGKSAILNHASTSASVHKPCRLGLNRHPGSSFCISQQVFRDWGEERSGWSRSAPGRVSDEGPGRICSGRQAEQRKGRAAALRSPPEE